MVTNFNRAETCYLNGQGAEAAHWSNNARTHQADRDRLQKQVKELIQELEELKQEVLPCAPAAELAAFEEASVAFKKINRDIEVASEKYRRLKQERHSLKKRFERLKAEYLQLKNQCQKLRMEA